ncbi:conjugal transfer protein [Ensifer sp. MPMI2T]|nr:conjugal transfer protein [Ensifer sp. MPMI2T]
MLLAGVAVAFVAVGPTQTLRIVGWGSDHEQRTSQVDLKVDHVITDHSGLDFLVPEPPAVVEPKSDPTAEMNKHLEELRKKIDAVARPIDSANFSLADVEQLLERYNKEMAQKLQEERHQAEAENGRLRAEAFRLEEERKRFEEVAKLDAEKRHKLQEINTKQRESSGVVVDESAARIASADGAPEDLSANDRFLASAAGSEVKTSVSRPLADPSRTVVQGTIISAALETAIDTELPGNIRAQVIEPVFSFDGSRILLAAGTRLVGTFSNRMDIEQTRVLITWNRAVTPDGKSIALGSTGADLLGRAGIEGNVDNRYVDKIGAAVLSSAITSLPSIIPALTGSNSSPRGAGTSINIAGAGSGDTNAGDQARALSAQGKGVLDKYLSLPPIIRVPQGEEIRVFVNQDLVIR